MRLLNSCQINTVWFIIYYGGLQPLINQADWSLCSVLIMQMRYSCPSFSAPIVNQVVTIYLTTYVTEFSSFSERNLRVVLYPHRFMIHTSESYLNERYALLSKHTPIDLTKNSLIGLCDLSYIFFYLIFWFNYILIEKKIFI